MTRTPNSPDPESDPSLAIRLCREAELLKAHKSKIDSSFDYIQNIIKQAQHLTGKLQMDVTDALYTSVFGTRSTQIQMDGELHTSEQLTERTRETVLDHMTSVVPKVPAKAEEYLAKVIDQIFQGLRPASQDFLDELKVFGHAINSEVLLTCQEQDARFTRLVLGVIDEAQVHSEAVGSQEVQLRTMKLLEKKLDEIQDPTPMVHRLKNVVQNIARDFDIDLSNQPTTQPDPGFEPELARLGNAIPSPKSAPRPPSW